MWTPTNGLCFLKVIALLISEKQKQKQKQNSEKQKQKQKHNFFESLHG